MNKYHDKRLRAAQEEREDQATARARAAVWLSAVRFLRGHIPAAEQTQVREELLQPEGLAPFHFWWGMSIRNALRGAGYCEEAFGVQNLDNIYIQLVTEAVAGPNQEER